MAEVDIISDDTQQANAKLNGVEALLAKIGALFSPEGNIINVSK